MEAGRKTPAVGGEANNEPMPKAEEGSQNTENARTAMIVLPVANDMANAPAQPAAQVQPLADLPVQSTKKCRWQSRQQKRCSSRWQSYRLKQQNKCSSCRLRQQKHCSSRCWSSQAQGQRWQSARAAGAAEGGGARATAPAAADDAAAVAATPFGAQRVQRRLLAPAAARRRGLGLVFVLV